MTYDKAINVIIEMLTENISGEKAKSLINKIYDCEYLDQKQITKLNAAYRLSRDKAQIDQGEDYWNDFMANLRQVSLYFKTDFTLSKNIINNTIDKCSKYNLILYEGQRKIRVLDKKYPYWFKENNNDSLDQKVIDDLYDLKQRRLKNKVIGDGILYNMTGFTHYLSKHQKAVVHASMDMPPGYTLLSCLPTGGGKSLASILPSYFENEGGTIAGGIKKTGVTIVVVPTVALALDQVNNSKKFFHQAKDEKHRPQAYHGGLSWEEKKLIFEGLRSGTIPLLFTSPESLMTGIMNEIVEEIANYDKINRLVIDEAHIVGSWGNIFRTEFQMLSVLQKKLYQISSGKLKTVLLSATITDKTANLLTDLFVIDDKLIEIRADKLRPEPSFWLDRNFNKNERYRKILNLIPLLPRPIILYTTKVDDAKIWHEKLRNYGFRNIEKFTGKTGKSRRNQILKGWANNNIDIMIATSAFGLGVDKKDVRTIIHCCLPESIDRYYQEVGRAGRDGFPSFSIISVYYNKYKNDDDFNVAKYLIDKILKTENLLDRWFAMKEDVEESKFGDEILIDTNVSPPHLEEQITGMRNANWNEVAILFLYRQKLIDIREISHEDGAYKILIKLLKPRLLSNRENLRKKIDNLRKKEQDQNYKEYKDMINLLSNPDKLCWGFKFNKIYSHTFLVCGGCPTCRNINGFLNPDMEADLFINNSYFDDNNNNNLTGKIGKCIGLNREMIIDYKLKDDNYFKLADHLIDANIKNLILPDEIDNQEWQKYLKYLPGEECNFYKAFQIKEILSAEYSLINSNVSIYYPEDLYKAEIIFNWTRKYLEENINSRVIHIVPKDLIFENTNKKIRNRIEGNWIKITKITNEVDHDIDLWF